MNQLPEILDCRDSASIRSASDRCGHPLVADVLDLLAAWNPSRPRRDNEREFQRLLVNQLLAGLPQSFPRTERYIGESERIDVLLGTEGRGVAIEMKHRLQPAAVRELYAQARAYAIAFRHRGPVLLVLCRTSPELRLPLQKLVADLRHEGHGVLAVLAAPGH